MRACVRACGLPWSVCGRGYTGSQIAAYYRGPVDKVGLETTGRLWPAASFYVAADILLSWYDNAAWGYGGVRINHL